MNLKEENKRINRPWIKYYAKSSLADLEYFEGTMFDAFKSTATKYPKAVAIDYMNVKFSYAQLYKDVILYANILKSYNISKGDRITICLPNIPQAVILFYAVLCLGAQANMIHPLSSGNEIEYCVNLSKSKLLFVFDAFANKVTDINCPTLQKIVYTGAAEMLPFYMRAAFYISQGKNIKAPMESIKICSLKTFFKEAQIKEFSDIDCVHDRDVQNTDTAAILYSGGTTGTQKGIMLSHLNFNALATQTARNGTDRIDIGDKMLAVLPMFHGFGLGVCIHTAIMYGMTIILVPRFNADSFANLLLKKKPSFIAGVPTLYEALLRNDRLKNVDFSKAKGIFAGGDTLPYDVKIRFDEELKKHNSKVLLREGFGLTECVTASALTPSSTYKKGSVGIPYSDTFYKIVEPETETELSYGEDGEICISGPTVMNGYLDNPEETARVLKKHKDGRTWLHTGDIGFMDEEGFIYFKSRLKRMIKCSGYSVYPSQTEEIINSHEAVSLSCVIGVHDDYKMNKLKAFIVLKDGFEPNEETKNSIAHYCRKNIATYALPKEFEFRDNLPLTKVGKVAYTILEKEEMTKNV